MLGTGLAFARVALRDARGARTVLQPIDRHLEAAEAWLCRAQDATPDGGISYGYSLRGGWRPSYPETSGYIATTFFRLARDRDASFAQRAARVLDWLLRVQNDDGSFPNPRYGRGGIVFDTGQVLFGLVRGYELTGRADWLSAAGRAAGWLTAVADPGQRWTRHEHLDTPHVYNTRTAWALLRLNEVEHDPVRERVARANLDWAVAQQQASGFFDHCSFEPGQAPFTHTLAYTARGLLESALLLRDERYLEAATKCADAALLHLGTNGHLPSMITSDGRSTARSCCLTGNCQFAIVWARLASVGERPGYRSAVIRALDFVMATQDLESVDPAVRGAIKGSHPVWGRYASMSFPNWATKFFVDALWLRREMEAA